MKYVVLSSVLFLASCATPHVVDIVQPNDEQLNCAGLQNEVDDIQAQINFLACMRERQKMDDDEKSGQSLFDQMFGG